VPLSVIVVDDASFDSSAVEHVARAHGATYVRLGTNLGPAGARNIGLEMVTTELAAFVDSDVVVDSQSLLRLARHCADPEVALVGPAVVGKTLSHTPRWFERYDVAASSLDLGKVGAQVRAGSAVAWLPSACLVGRVEHLESGFEDSMRIGEDVDLVWRLTSRGRVVRYDPTVRAHHEVRPTVRAWLGRKFLYGTGGAELARRHGNNVAPAVLSPVMAAGAIALLTRDRRSPVIAAAAVSWSAGTLYKALPLCQGRANLAVRLSLRGLGWAIRQESGLLLRHWWPLAALAALRFSGARHAVLTAAVVDTVIFRLERKNVGLVTTLFARRADDIAYGAGLWVGAARRRSIRCLLPKSAAHRPQRR
jgi:mycofactocin system glycosyltransferase